MVEGAVGVYSLDDSALVVCTMQCPEHVSDSDILFDLLSDYLLELRM